MIECFDLGSVQCKSDCCDDATHRTIPAAVEDTAEIASAGIEK
jgi:hypothetical protein